MNAQILMGGSIAMTALFSLGYLLGEQRGWKKGVQKMQETYPIQEGETA